MFDLTQQRALVTGATGGIGQAIAQALVHQGARVIITGRRQEALDALADQLGPNCHGIACAFDQADALEGLVDKAEEKWGGLDILVNNAGITRDGLALRMKDDDFMAVLETNLKAPFILIRRALKKMMKQRHGRIINMGSVVGYTGNPGQANYCASKMGLVGMSKALAKEVASRGITVNCIAPGFIETPMTEVLNEEQRQAIMASIPLGAMGHPDDIAGAVVYLASAAGRYVTGQTLHVNGGMAMV